MNKDPQHHSLPPDGPDARTVAKQAFLLFISMWVLFAAFTNTRDARQFNLQHAGVEALVERHTLHVDGSRTPELVRVGDTFKLAGHLYPLKAPGQFLCGALVYWPLHFLVRYENHFDITAWLVVVGTAGLLAAAGVAFLDPAEVS